MKVLQCQKGTDEVNHGGTKYTVNNSTWRVAVDDEVADFMLANGKAGVYLVEEPDPADENTVRCPHCGFFLYDDEGELKP